MLNSFRKNLIINSIVGVFVGFFISVILFVLLARQIPSSFLDARTLNSVTSNLDRNFTYKVLTVPLRPENFPSIIVWGNDKNFNELCYGTDKRVRVKNKPIIKIFKKNDFTPLSLIPFFKQDYKLYTEFSFSLPHDDNLNRFTNDVNDDYWISDVKVEDLDGDGSDEIIVRAYSYICGSGGNLYLFILKDTGKGLELIPGIPEISIHNQSNEKVDLTYNTNVYTNTGEKKKLIYASTDTYAGFEDLDNDGLKELILGFDTWLSDDKFNISNYECHLCGHTWYIGVYKYHNGNYLVDNNWNHGLLYITDKKIPLGDALGYPDSIVYNTFALLGEYYYECKEEICKPFYNLTRKKSEILKLVEENYGKFKSFWSESP